MRSMLGWLQQWTCLKARVVLCKFVCSNVYIFIYLMVKKNLNYIFINLKKKKSVTVKKKV